MDDDDGPVVFGTGVEDFRQAESLADHFEGKWRYDFSTKLWHGWNGIRWAPDNTDRLRRKVAEYAATNVIKATNDNTRKPLVKLLSLQGIDKALEALATFDGYGTDGADWDQDPFLLGCKNGIVDLRTNTLITDPDPTMLVTKTTGRHFKPIAGPAEWSERAPVFMGFMDQITSDDPSMVAFLLLWFGASLFGFTPEQRFLLMTGIGRNGKGSLQHAIMKATGDYGFAPDSNLYSRSKFGPAQAGGARADLIGLKGKRLAFLSEPDKGQFNEELLKAHTGGDPITARTLYSAKIITWEPTHSITFLVNNAPEVEDLGPSMTARVMVADFRETFDGDKEDKSLYRKLEAEADGILAILAYAANAWYVSWDSGEGGLSLPPRVIEQSRVFMQRNDPIAQALNEAFRVGPGLKAAARLCYEAYVQWHVRSDQEGEPMSEHKFGAAMLRKGIRREKGRMYNYYIGIQPLGAMALAENGDGDDDEDE